MKIIIKTSVACLMTLSALAGCSSKSGKYTAGSYTGEAQGFGGTISVTITTDTDKITDVKVVGDSETAEIGGAHLEELAAAILEKKVQKLMLLREQL